VGPGAAKRDPLPGTSRKLLADALNILTTRCRTEVRRNFFANKVAEKWNKLPENIKVAGNIKTLKSLYDKILEQQE